MAGRYAGSNPALNTMYLMDVVLKVQAAIGWNYIEGNIVRQSCHPLSTQLVKNVFNMIYNPYRYYDKGMDDAYVGNEPLSNRADYMSGYDRALQIEIEEERRAYAKEQEKQYWKDYEDHLKSIWL